MTFVTPEPTLRADGELDRDAVFPEALVYRVHDFLEVRSHAVHFVHEAHIRYFSEKEGVEVGQVCQKCHGDVAAMEKVQQVENLKMGDCVSCHKDNGAPTDCTTCHY